MPAKPVKKSPKQKKAVKAPPQGKNAAEQSVSPAVSSVEAAGSEAVADSFSNTERYWEAVGRRKTAIARVRLYTKGEKGIWVNGKSADSYFQYSGFMTLIDEPLEKMKSSERFRISAKISGGGRHAQAEALRHGISRALVKFNPDFRKRLKRAGLLTRDPRMKERKKFGLKGARRAPQWQKR